MTDTNSISHHYHGHVYLSSCILYSFFILLHCHCLVQKGSWILCICSAIPTPLFSSHSILVSRSLFFFFQEAISTNLLFHECSMVIKCTSGEINVVDHAETSMLGSLLNLQKTKTKQQQQNPEKRKEALQ